MNVAVHKLNRFYAAIVCRVKHLTDFHADRLQCRRGCSGCCVDNITVWNVEAENIRQNAVHLLLENAHENGACAFLDENGGCRIYESRPYVCRTQGLPLRWFDEIDREIYEFRDICPLNENGAPIEELTENECWTIGEPETHLAELQSEFDNGTMRRILLRELFDEIKKTNDSSENFVDYLRAADCASEL